MAGPSSRGATWQTTTPTPDLCGISFMESCHQNGPDMLILRSSHYLYRQGPAKHIYPGLHTLWVQPYLGLEFLITNCVFLFILFFITRAMQLEGS